MKTKALGAVVMVAFSAVLWVRVFNAYYDERNTFTSWKSIRPYNHLAECQKGLNENVKTSQDAVKNLAKNSNDKYGFFKHGTWIYREAHDWLQEDSFFCFPKGFNPRPRKRKQPIENPSR